MSSIPRQKVIYLKNGRDLEIILIKMLATSKFGLARKWVWFQIIIIRHHFVLCKFKILHINLKYYIHLAHQATVSIFEI